MKEYISVLKKYAVFSGRASRREYWMFTLFNIIVSFILGFIEGIFLGLSDTGPSTNYSWMDNGVLGDIYSLIVLLPIIGVSIRRNHDTGKSGWWILMPIYNLILALTPGDESENQYGPDPYQDKGATAQPTPLS